jgi:hypothetical protein
LEENERKDDEKFQKVISIFILLNWIGNAIKIKTIGY